MPEPRLCVHVPHKIYGVLAMAAGGTAWLLWGCVVAMIAVSRVYVAAHLPLQTVWGAVGGACSTHKRRERKKTDV